MIFRCNPTGPARCHQTKRLSWPKLNIPSVWHTGSQQIGQKNWQVGKKLYGNMAWTKGIWTLDPLLRPKCSSKHHELFLEENVQCLQNMRHWVNTRCRLNKWVISHLGNQSINLMPDFLDLVIYYLCDLNKLLKLSFLIWEAEIMLVVMMVVFFSQSCSEDWSINICKAIRMASVTEYMLYSVSYNYY